MDSRLPTLYNYLCSQSSTALACFKLKKNYCCLLFLFVVVYYSCLLLLLFVSALCREGMADPEGKQQYLVLVCLWCVCVFSGVCPP